MAHVPAFLYLFCTHVPAHAVLFAPEAAALHVRSASHAYSEQVGLGRQRLDTLAQHRPLRRSPSPAVVRVCCVLSPFVSSPVPAKAREWAQDYRVGKAGGCYASLQNLVF